MSFIADIILFVTRLYALALLLLFLTTWFPQWRQNGFIAWVASITEPLCNRVAERWPVLRKDLDLTPGVLMLAILIGGRLLAYLFG